MMSRETGRRMDMLAHISQSVADIITTPIGSRVMRRDYGSLVPDLIDQPDSPATQTRIYAAVAGALMRWEPRINVQKVSMSRNPERNGWAAIEITGVYTGEFGRDSSAVSLSVPLGAYGGANA